MSRAQGDALDIEAQAKRRLADEYDAAQQRGEVRTAGQPEKNSSKPEEFLSMADVGLTHKEIHEARQIRDAEASDPGVVRRTGDPVDIDRCPFFSPSRRVWRGVPRVAA